MSWRVGVSSTQGGRARAGKMFHPTGTWKAVPSEPIVPTFPSGPTGYLHHTSYVDPLLWKAVGLRGLLPGAPALG